jgi:predicted GNAT superfamily acetyltransferase
MSERSTTITSSALVESAWRDAEAAAAAAGVVVRTVATTAEAHEVSRILAEIWPQSNGASQIEPNLARALAHSGNYISIAWSADESRALGACVAFFGSPSDRHAHSHIAGVIASQTGGGIGIALKMHQRAWCLERDVLDISWTFDPLISRNAHFNLVRLGAVVSEYLPDFYGSMSDARNGGQTSDRLLVSWRLEPTAADAPAVDHVQSPALVRLADGRPEVAADAVDTIRQRSAATLLIPAEFEELRANDPAQAVLWREIVADVLALTLGSGDWRIAGFQRNTGYLLEKL